jgi:hypothetical protein
MRCLREAANISMVLLTKQILHVKNKRDPVLWTGNINFAFTCLMYVFMMWDRERIK